MNMLGLPEIHCLILHLQRLSLQPAQTNSSFPVLGTGGGRMGRLILEDSGLHHRHNNKGVLLCFAKYHTLQCCWALVSTAVAYWLLTIEIRYSVHISPHTKLQHCKCKAFHQANPYCIKCDRYLLRAFHIIQFIFLVVWVNLWRNIVNFQLI